SRSIGRAAGYAARRTLQAAPSVRSSALAEDAFAVAQQEDALQRRIEDRDVVEPVSVGVEQPAVARCEAEGPAADREAALAVAVEQHDAGGVAHDHQIGE